MDYLQFEITGRRDGVVEIRLAGELDLASGSVVEVSLDHLLRTSDADTVVIDLRDLTYCDAAGLNVFSAAQRDAAKRARKSSGDRLRGPRHRAVRASGRHRTVSRGR